LWLASVAAIIPLIAIPLPSASAMADAVEPFQPPAGPMLLTRTTRRPLHDGKEVLARRSYEVRFVRESGGYRLDGKLVEVVVEAPPILQGLAELERQRPDDGLFPMHLDATGQLIAGGNPKPSRQAGQAIDLVSAAVDKSGLGAAEKAQARAFVQGFRDRPGYNPWPQELFRPPPGERRETRTIPLPNGESGQITVDLTARTAGPGGLLASFTRTTTSDLGGDKRSTYEQWTLAPNG
jgi:hypothetical protein